MQLVEGDWRTPIGRYALVAARFNAVVVDRLIEGARDTLQRHGVADDAIDLIRVPGSLEIPITVQRLAKSRRYMAVIALGAIVRGDTAHFDVVVAQSASGLASIALATDIPVLNAILTTDTMEQAIDRAGGKQGNKGAEAAAAALEMASLFAKLAAMA